MHLLKQIPLLPLLATLAHTTPINPLLFPPITNVTIFTPPPTYTSPGVLYARTALLPSGALLATWENYSPQPPLVYYPIYRSLDGGATWTHLSNITDQANNWGLRYQPFLYVLPEPLGGFPAGTVLAAGNSIPANLSATQIDLYASTDGGCSWGFVSHIASGGEAVPDDGLTPVWEPFLLAYEGQLVVFYSDQRDPAHGQKLSHQVSTDLRNWGEPVDDVAYADYAARPGMTTVTALPDGTWLMTYEYGGAPGFANYSFPVYYRQSTSPLTFASSPGTQLIATDGSEPQSSPYVTWTPVGGVVVSCGTDAAMFVNSAPGVDAGAWRRVDTVEGVSYSRSLRVMPDPNHLLIIGAGSLPPAVGNKVTVSVVKMEEWLP